MANPRAFKRLQPSQPRYRRQPLTNWSVRQPGLGFPGAMIFGCTGKANADDRQFDPLYATAERLRVPLYLHPQTPIESVMQAYYAGFGKQVDYMFGTYGLGWYYDNGVQLLRLIFSGVFDRYPDTVIVGHWGEVVLFYLEHIATMQATGLHLDRPLVDYFRQNVWVTGSGLLSERYLRWTAEVVGVGPNDVLYRLPFHLRDLLPAFGYEPQARAPVPRAGAAKRSGEGGHRRWQLGAVGPGISVCQPARERCSYVSMVRMMSELLWLPNAILSLWMRRS